MQHTLTSQHLLPGGALPIGSRRFVWLVVWHGCDGQSNWVLQGAFRGSIPAPPELAPHLSPYCFQIFTRTCDSTRRIALMLRNLGFGAVPIHGQMGQPKRLGALNKFKAGERNILVATDVASRCVPPCVRRS